MEYNLIFGILALIFTLLLALILNDMFTSYCIAIWYFTKKKDTVKIPILYAMKTVFKYHFGSCVFITIVLMFL